jgi:hypothetical protein
VYVPAVDGNWVSKTEDVELVVNPPATATTTDPEPALRNPHGLAQSGDYLYFIDYDNHYIVPVNKNTLEGVGNGATLGVDVYDVVDDVTIASARGQAIIALDGQIYALFNDVDLDPAEEYEPSRLVRLNTNSQTGALSFDAVIQTGLNSQSIIPVTRKENDVAVVYLLVPAIGGPQKFNGITNGTASGISAIQANGSWPADPVATAPVIVTGDPMPTPPAQPGSKNAPTPSDATAYDIHAVGAAMRGGDSLIFILTQVYTDEAKNAFWMLYQTTVDDFLAIPPNTTLTAATQITGGGIDLLDQGLSQSPDPQFADAIYFWDILYEQTLRNDDEEDRLWLLLGSPFLVTKAEAYASPSTPFANPFVMFSGFGGVNVNSVDLIIETLHQAQREVSLKRGTRAARLTASAGRAGVAATATGGTEEEEEGK